MKFGWFVRGEKASDRLPSPPTALYGSFFLFSWSNFSAQIADAEHHRAFIGSSYKDYFSDHYRLQTVKRVNHILSSLMFDGNINCIQPKFFGDWLKDIRVDQRIRTQHPLAFYTQKAAFYGQQAAFYGKLMACAAACVAAPIIVMHTFLKMMEFMGVDRISSSAPVVQAFLQWSVPNITRDPYSFRNVTRSITPSLSRPDPEPDYSQALDFHASSRRQAQVLSFSATDLTSLLLQNYYGMFMVLLANHSMDACAASLSALSKIDSIPQQLLEGHRCTLRYDNQARELVGDCQESQVSCSGVGAPKCYSSVALPAGSIQVDFGFGANGCAKLTHNPLALSITRDLTKTLEDLSRSRSPSLDPSDSWTPSPDGSDSGTPSSGHSDSGSVTPSRSYYDSMSRSLVGTPSLPFSRTRSLFSSDTGTSSWDETVSSTPTGDWSRSPTLSGDQSATPSLSLACNCLCYTTSNPTYKWYSNNSTGWNMFWKNQTAGGIIPGISTLSDNKQCLYLVYSTIGSCALLPGAPPNYICGTTACCAN